MLLKASTKWQLTIDIEIEILNEITNIGIINGVRPVLNVTQIPHQPFKMTAWILLLDSCHVNRVGLDTFSESDESSSLKWSQIVWKYEHDTILFLNSRIPNSVVPINQPPKLSNYKPDTL